MTLEELINSDRANAGRTDAERLAWLNEAVSVFVDVSWLDLGMWVAQHNLRPSLITAATATGGTAAIRTAAQHILDCIAAGQPLYASDERVREVIGTAMPAGDARDDLVAMATTLIPRWNGVTDWRDPMDSAEQARRLHDIGEAR